MNEKLLKLIGLTDESQVIQKMMELGYTDVKIDELEMLENIRTLRSKYGASDEAVKNIARRRIDLIVNKECLENIRRTQSSFRIQDYKIGRLLPTSWVSILNHDVTHIRNVQRMTGLSLAEMQSLILHSLVPVNRTPVEDVAKNKELFEIAGLPRENLWRAASYLSYDPRQLSYIIQLAKVNGIELNELAGFSAVVLPAKKFFSRLKAIENDGVPRDALFVNDFDFQRLSGGVRDGEYILKYPFGPREKVVLERKFTQQFPELKGVVVNDPKELLRSVEARQSAFHKTHGPLTPSGYLTYRGLYYGLQKHLKKNPKLAELDGTTFANNIMMIEGLVGRIGVTKMVLACPMLCANGDERIKYQMNYMNDRYDMNAVEFALAFSRNPEIAYIESDEMEYIEREYTKRYGISKEMFKEMLIFAPALINCPASESAPRVRFFEELTKLYEGIKSGENVSCLNSRSVLQKIKLGMINGLSLAEAVENTKFSKKVIYAKTKGADAGLISREAVYSTAMCAGEVDGQKISELLQRFPYDEFADFEIEERFKKQYPEYEALFNLINRDISLDFARRETAIKEANDKRTKEQKLLGTKLQHLFGLTEDESEKLSISVGEVSADKMRDIVYNFYNLTELGFKTSEIIEMPNILRSNPEQTKVKALMATLNGKSDRVFLKKGYTYNADGVYAKIEEAKRLGKTPKYLYDSTADFLGYIGSEESMEEIKSRHPFDTGAKKALQEEFDNKFRCVNSNLAEVDTNEQ